MMRIYFKYLVLVVISISVLSACKSTKYLKNKELRKLKIDKIYNQIEKNEIEFNTISLRFSAATKIGKKKLSAKGNIRIKNDSIIWISVKPLLGIEMFRIVITKDSLKYINRIEKNYYCSNTDLIKKKYFENYKYEYLQDILTNSIINFYGKKTKNYLKKNYKLEINKNNYCIKNVKNKIDDNSFLLSELHVKPDTYKINEIRFKSENSEQELIVKYKDFDKLDEFIYPKNVDIEVIDDKNIFNLKINYDKINLNRSLKFPFSISKKYTKISL
ncbi:MAG: DUF4292 domain-containing protein [Bacteroidales bacterium]|nr:DUF4292 domain-containing protein [Bacteroidales bacterium]